MKCEGEFITEAHLMKSCESCLSNHLIQGYLASLSFSLKVS